jgi:hypothetical protein
VRQDVVGEEDRLRVLEVRTAGHGHVRVGLGQADEGVLEVGDQAADDPGVVAQVHPEERGDLVVAGPAGAELAAEVGAETLEQAALEGGVDVLVGDGAGEVAGRHVGLEPVESVEHPRQLVVGEQTRLLQDAGVGTGAGDVVRREPPVEVHGRGQLRQRLCRTVGEAAAPEPDVTVVAAHSSSSLDEGVKTPPRRDEEAHCSTQAPYARSRLAAIFCDRPKISMKPCAFDWSNVSPES